MIINKLNALLRERDISPVAFAIRVGKSRQWIYELCAPGKTINDNTLNMICETLHVQVSDVKEYIPDALAVQWERGMPLVTFARKLGRSPAWVVEHFPPREEPAFSEEDPL